jgi:hypothetical protein
MSTSSACRPVVAAAIVLVGVLNASPAQAAAPTNGCPDGYQLLAVSDLAPQGYQVPGKVDDPTSGIRSFGRFGNGDGLVCAVPLGNQLTPWGGQVYNFWDNTLGS